MAWLLVIVEFDWQVHFKFEFSTRNVDTNLGAIKLKAEVNSTNAEAEGTLGDNSATLIVPMEVETNIVLAGASRPDQEVYEKADAKSLLKFDRDAGPLVSHIYELRNQGPSAIKRAVLDIYWPSFTQSGANLLYLVDDPETQGNVVCSIKQQANVNPDSLTVSSLPPSLTFPALKPSLSSRSWRGDPGTTRPSASASAASRTPTGSRRRRRVRGRVSGRS